MGLDMWLDKRNVYESREQNVEIAYWRKANAIHRFFTKYIKDDVNCKEIPVEEHDIEQLRESCQQVLDGIKDGRTELPTMEGFFFGSTEYKSNYRYDLEQTVEMLDRAYDKGLLPLKEDERLYYFAWY